MPANDNVTRETPAVEFRTYLRVIWRRRWAAAATLVVTVLSAAAFTFTQIPIFQASATVLIEPEAPRVMNIQDPAQMYGHADEYYATQYRIIQSRPVVEGAIRRFKLQERIPALRSAADPYRRFVPHLAVEPVKNTRLVLVKFADPDPKLAAEVANAVADAYVRYNLELKHKIAQDAVVWLNDQLGALKGQTQQSSKALQTYQTQADLLGAQDQRQVTQQKMVDSNRAYLDAQEKRLTLETRLRELSRVAQDSKGADTILFGADDPLIRKLKTEASDLQVERSKLAQISKDKHPDLQQLDAQIRQVNQRLQAELQRLLQALETEHKVARAREEALLANVQELRREARKLYEREAQAGSLQRERDSTDELHGLVLKRLKETGMATALEANNIRVVEAATPPPFPIKPRTYLTMVLSIVGGLGLGIGVAFLADSLDNKIRSPLDVERAVGLPVLGIVPVFETRGRR